jgi:aspartate/methionine/tyrosine aminotransferase
MEKYKTMVGPGHWFSMPDTYMRIGFGWTDKKTFERGLGNISKAVSDN